MDDPLPEEFRVQIDTSGDCWLWIGPLSESGYGWYRHEVHPQKRVHRFAWESLVALIPPGMTIDHLCFVKRCVNPDHLRMVSRSENSKGGPLRTRKNKRMTECLQGHPFDEENTYVRPDGYRGCRKCHAARQQRRYTQNKSQTTGTRWLVS